MLRQLARMIVGRRRHYVIDRPYWGSGDRLIEAEHSPLRPGGIDNNWFFRAQELEAVLTLLGLRGTVKCRHTKDIYLVGGFASYQFGIHHSYGDVDILCTTTDAFMFVSGRLNRIVDDNNNSGPFWKWLGVVKHWPEVAGVKNIDVILSVPMNVYDRERDLKPESDIHKYLMSYDLSWSMCAYSPHTDSFLYHPDFLERDPIINSSYPLHRGRTYHRVKKYAERRRESYKRPTKRGMQLALDYIADMLATTLTGLYCEKWG
jgi:hypothetical protein